MPELLLTSDRLRIIQFYVCSDHGHIIGLTVYVGAPVPYLLYKLDVK